MRDQDFGPTIAPGARRDPRLSIRRDEPPRASEAGQLIQQKTAAITSRMGRAAFALLCVTAAGGVLVLLGLLLHIVWAAIMAGWTILP